MPLSVTDNITQWGGIQVSPPPASKVPATGTELAPVVKTLGRKSTDLVLPVSVTSAASQLSAWQDTQTTGAVGISISCVFQNGNFSTVAVVQSDDQVGIFT